MNTPTLTSSATLRPRNRRRTNEDDNDASSSLSAVSYFDSPSASGVSSRAFSPSSTAGGLRTPRRAPQPPASTTLQVPPSTLWGSTWSSLKTIASDVVGNRASRPSSPTPSPSRTRLSPKHPTNRSSSTPATTWGPSAPADRVLGLGTKDWQRAELEAKKRERFLIANGESVPDGSGQYKRRDSDDRNRGSRPPSENEERDVLVYVHRVKPGDTLAGVMIKYNCQPHIFRKVNRLWPNDSIQVRKMVLLPVDACSVRGRLVAESEIPIHHFKNQQNTHIVPTPKASESPWKDSNNKKNERETPLSSIPTSPSISVTFSNTEEAYKHDSWVQISGFSEATEIARLSRSALGYFPRSRRKSPSFMDLESPITSLELARDSFQSDSTHNLRRSRSSSIAHLQSRAGGVGTLNRNVRIPGPANDGLNKMFPGLEQRMASRSPVELQSFNSNGLENVGGAIEGWVRKVASRASSTFQSPALSGHPSEGDLIELSEDAFDLRDDRQLAPNTRDNPLTDVGHDSWITEQAGMRQDSFPPRGRTFEDLSKRRS